MTLTKYADAFERYEVDTATGAGAITFRAATPPKDTPLLMLDDHFLSARVVAPLKKPWPDTQDSVHVAGSPGWVHAIVAEAARPWSEVAATLTANTNKALARPVNFIGKLVCMHGGLSPCSKSIQHFQWCCCHHFRPIRYLVQYLRWGWPSDKLLAQCALSRIAHEPTLKDVPKSQRDIGWPLLLLAEAYKTDIWTPEAEALTNDLIQRLWDAPRGDNYICLHTSPPPDHLGQCSWMLAILNKAFGRLIRKGWADQRAAVLYKAGIKGLDAMRDGQGSWFKDWQPVDQVTPGGVLVHAAGKTMATTTPFAGTTLLTACVYAESLALLTAAAPDRRAYLKAWMGKSNALKPTDKNFDAASHALLTALVP